MRIKFFLIYVFVGIAFLAVSAWVFLSGGKNARAIRAKYRLGGILIMASAMISVASCTAVKGILGDDGMVTCYEPAHPDPTEDILSLTLPQKTTNKIQAGDVIRVEIGIPTTDKYALMIYYWTSSGSSIERHVLQRTDLTVEDPENAVFEVVVSDSIEYRGEALMDVFRIVDGEPEEYGLRAPYSGDLLVEII